MVDEAGLLFKKKKNKLHKNMVNEAVLYNMGTILVLNVCETFSLHVGKMKFTWKLL